MLKLDTLNQLKQLKQDIKASRNLAEGIVKGSAYKFGFVTLDSGKDVYLPPDEMERVLPGDRVEVEIVKDAKNKKVAKLERLIKSTTKVFCGKYISKGKAAFVEPDIVGMTRWFFIPPQKRNKANAKDLVMCKVTQHPYKSGKAQASIVEVIGNDQDSNIEQAYASKKYQLNSDWNKSALAQLERITEDSIVEQAKDREDLSSLPFVTIDSPQTKDIDDALYAEKLDNGWKLHIAIADPCALIEPGSEIEKELSNRSASVYFPGSSIAMLPEKLGSDLCSLVEGKGRLAKVVSVAISDQGEIGQAELKSALINSHKKLNYDEVAAFLDEEQLIEACSEDITTSLKNLQQIASVRQAYRQKTGPSQSERDEFYLELDEQGKISEIKRKHSNCAHRIVEEAMLVANSYIAQTLDKAKLAGIFIAHKGIRADRLESLNKVLLEKLPGYQDGEISTLAGFIKCSQGLSSNSEQSDLQLLISRQLEKSQLSLEAAPHFGLGLESYCNFTSPLRKAADFYNHRQIDAWQQDKQVSLDANLLAKLDEASQRVKGAVYDVEQWLKCQYLAKSTEVFKGKVQRIFSSGFQVRLLDTGIEGFISTKEMEGKFSFNQDLLSITHKDFSFTLDQEVSVKLKHIDWSRKQIQFELA